CARLRCRSARLWHEFSTRAAMARDRAGGFSFATLENSVGILMNRSTPRRFAVIAACGLALLSARTRGATATVTIDVNHPGADIPPMFYGLMTEEINHAYDGGLYAELLQNRT